MAKKKTTTDKMPAVKPEESKNTAIVSNIILGILIFLLIASIIATIALMVLVKDPKEKESFAIVFGVSDLIMLFILIKNVIGRRSSSQAKDCIDNQVSESVEPQSVFSKAIVIIVQKKQASTFILQRYLYLGISKAEAIIEMFERLHYIGPLQNGEREIYVTESDLPKAIKVLDDAAAQAESKAEQADISMKHMNESSTDLLAQIDAMSEHGQDFELLTVKLLLANGFEKACATQGSGDYGIDVIAEKEGVTYAIQCKCYSGSVGNKAVQEAFSGKAYYNCMIAVVFTNNFFTNAAIETAKKTNVLLWDRNKLIEFLNNYK